ncbi:MAG: hypothetical protein V4760_06805 [Bdellovibrionota bacterium]
MRFSTLAALILAVSFSVVSFASDGPKMAHKPLEPAKRYSGQTPIDLSNGLPGNNGTYGLPNHAYEAWAKSKKIAPSLNDAAYPYDMKKSLIESLDEQILWGESAIANWKNNSSSKAEVGAYAKQATETMDPLLAKLKDATKSVKGAGTGDWSNAEAGARRAAAEFRAGYRSLHRNATH